MKPQIVFESRLINNVGNNCLMTINGTNFRIQQKGVARKGNPFGSHKYVGKSALRYKLGWTSSREIWFGSRDCTTQVHGTT
jgi:hypothetical protein